MLLGFFKTVFIFYRTLVYSIAASKKNADYYKIKKNWSQEILKILGFKLVIKNVPSDEKKIILLGNHISYLDIIVLFAAYPNVIFLAKSEVANWPIIGPGAKNVGTLFVHRDSSQSRLLTKNKIQDFLENDTSDLKIAAFPSGTTTLSEEKPWKKGLFEVAQITNTKVQPFKIKYSHKRECAYIDEDDLFTSLMKLFSIKNKSVVFEWGTAFTITNLDDCIEKARAWTQV